MKYLTESGKVVESKPFKGTDIKTEDRVIYHEVEKVVKTGEGENDFIVKKIVEVQERCNLDEYINSFADDTGIMNIVSKVVKTGDITLLNQKSIQYADITNMPENMAEADAMLEAGKKAAADLGIAYSEEALKKYIADAIAKATAEAGQQGAEGGAE